MIFITYTSISEPIEIGVFNHYINQLTSVEKDKILRYLRWQDAHASLAGKILLTEALKQAGIDQFCLKDILRDSYGKPYLPNGPAFNISHSGKYVVCAISTTDIPGIDIEEVRSIGFEDFDGHFTANEWLSINNADNSLEAFFQHWCAKEAFIKKDGKGLSNKLNEIEVNGNNIIMGNIRNYIQYINIFPGYKMALASSAEMEYNLKHILIAEYV